MQTWLPLIKELEKNNTYGWLPNPSDLVDNVQHVPSFSLHSQFSNAHPSPTSLFPLQDASKPQPVRQVCPHPSQSVTLMAEGPLRSPLPNKHLMLVELANSLSLSVSLSLCLFFTFISFGSKT
jgi:hypothetical protein